MTEHSSESRTGRILILLALADMVAVSRKSCEDRKDEISEIDIEQSCDQPGRVVIHTISIEVLLPPWLSFRSVKTKESSSSTSFTLLATGGQIAPETFPTKSRLKFERSLLCTLTRGPAAFWTLEAAAF